MEIVAGAKIGEYEAINKHVITYNYNLRKVISQMDEFKNEIEQLNLR